MSKISHGKGGIMTKLTVTTMMTSGRHMHEKLVFYLSKYRNRPLLSVQMGNRYLNICRSLNDLYLSLCETLLN